jgi:hypothetical protein
VGLHHPAHVAGAVRAQLDLARRLLAVQQRLDGLHRADEPLALLARQLREHRTGQLARALVEHRPGLAPLVGQRQRPGARVVRRRLALHHPAPPQALQQPRQVPQVEVQVAPELARRGLAAAADLVHQARLGPISYTRRASGSG